MTVMMIRNIICEQIRDSYAYFMRAREYFIFSFYKKKFNQ